MNPPPATEQHAGATATAVGPETVDLECLILDGCHAREGFLQHPCDAHAEEVLHLHAALVRAATGADGELRDDALAVAAELAGAIVDREVRLRRGAA